MEIYLLRHGNTFEEYDTPVWLGSKQDLELTNYGKHQAELSANYFKEIKIDKIIASPLKRTKVFAEIVSKKLNMNYELDQRLAEIDFGIWGGLSNQQIAKNFGNETLNNWLNHGVFPENCGWMPSPAQIQQEISSLIGSLDFDKVILVSSQVRIRYFLSLIDQELEKRLKNGSFKVSPGSISKISKINDNWKLDFWNYKPDASS